MVTHVYLQSLIVILLIQMENAKNVFLDFNTMNKIINVNVELIIVSNVVNI